MSIQYQQNFDGLVAGTTPANWTNKTGTPAKVQAAVPYSGVNSMGANNADGDYALLTGITLAANQAVQYVQQLVVALNCFISPILRDDGTGANHYLLFVNFAAPTVTLFKKVTGSYTSINALSIPNNSFNGRNVQVGDYVVCKADITGSTVTCKLGLAGTDESSWVVLTWTDSTYSTGSTAGVRQNNAPGTASGVDNFYAGDAGTTFTKIIHVNDASIYVPDSTYVNGSTYAQTAAPGTLLKVDLPSTTIGVNVDVSPLVTGSIAAGNYPWARLLVDEVATDVQLSSPQIQVSGLAAGTHKLEVMLLRSLQTVDRYTNPTNVLRVTGIMVDGGVTPVAPTLQSKRLLALGDSGTEGILATSASYPAGNDSLQIWPRMLGAALGAEVIQLGWGGIGYSTAGNGNVPHTINSYKNHFSGQARTYHTVDDVVVALGTNDMGLVADDVVALLSDIRTTLGASTWIWAWVPWGGQNRSTITAAVASLAATDPRINLLDNGTLGQRGFGNGATIESPDGTHPYAWNHGLQASMLAEQIQARKSAVGSATVGQVTGYLYIRDGHGNIVAEAGHNVSFTLTDPRAAGDAWSQAEFTVASDSTGKVTTVLAAGAQYKVRMGSSTTSKTISTGSTSPFQIPEVIGSLT